MSEIIQCVLVLYNSRFDQTPAGISLVEALRDLSVERDSIALLAYDNSQLASECALPPLAIYDQKYVHDPQNGGLAAAYSTGLNCANKNGADWLLLLDQDTTFTARFLREVMGVIHQGVAGNVAAVVPTLLDGDVVVSPKPVPFSILQPLKGRRRPRFLIVLNSGACLRVKALESIGGFPRDFWLDFLDHVVFYRLQSRGWTVRLLSSKLKHELSIRDIPKKMSIERYRNMLEAEARFLDETLPSTRKVTHRLLLIVKAAYLAVTVHDKRFAYAAFTQALAPRANERRFHN